MLGTCATPECNDHPGHGSTGLFCEHCAGELAAIREQLRVEGLYQKRVDQKGYHRPTCSSFGCSEPRPRGEAFCAVCRAMDEGLAA